MNALRICAVAALISGVVAGCESRGGSASVDDKGAASGEPVTLAVVNARVWTGDSARVIDELDRFLADLRPGG